MSVCVTRTESCGGQFKKGVNCSPVRWRFHGRGNFRRSKRHRSPGSPPNRPIRLNPYIYHRAKPLPVLNNFPAPGPHSSQRQLQQTMADHAVFLVHGLWGNKAHFWFVEEQIRLTYPSLKIHSCSVNEGNKTYDGIDVGGDRVVAEVRPRLGGADWRLWRRWRNGKRKGMSSPSSRSWGIPWVQSHM